VFDNFYDSQRTTARFFLAPACGPRARRSEFFETARVGEQLAQYAPRLLGGGVHRRRRLATEQIERRDEVVRTAAVLEAADELQENAVDAVTETRLVPLRLARMLFTLVQ